jgi:hypothetical protein
MGLSNEPNWKQLKEIVMESKILTQTYPHIHIGINMISPYTNICANQEEAVKFTMATY